MQPYKSGQSSEEKNFWIGIEEYRLRLWFRLAIVERQIRRKSIFFVLYSFCMLLFSISILLWLAEHVGFRMWYFGFTLSDC